MAGLCEDGNEPPGSLKARLKNNIHGEIEAVTGDTLRKVMASLRVRIANSGDKFTKGDVMCHQLHEVHTREYIKYGQTGVREPVFVVQKYRVSIELPVTVVRSRSGRSKKLESNYRRAVLRSVRENPKIIAQRLAAMVKEDYGVEVIFHTIRNVTKDEGYRGRVARKKPYVSNVNKQKRLAFAEEHVNKPQDLNSVIIFSGSDGSTMVWRKPSAQLQSKNNKKNRYLAPEQFFP
ncbi:hypothetical protein ANN_21533 [Periplaneta americana]|uniref:Transposase Tc1-like domain-containing protein n=1 Tax=Periplaneta americana TaxID=6978 RepID=A0ABQ8S684_PERAM|nr:hypothetical protein ANN_21533 [Periplaneta americana]